MDQTSNHPEAANSFQDQHSLKVEEYRYKFSLADPVYSLIRLKGRWLARMFPPNSRVVIEVGEGFVTIRKDS